MITAGKLCQIAVALEQAHKFIRGCDSYQGTYMSRLDLLVDLRVLRYDIEGSLSLLDVKVDLDTQEEK